MFKKITSSKCELETIFYQRIFLLQNSYSARTRKFIPIPTDSGVFTEGGNWLPQPFF